MIAPLWLRILITWLVIFPLVAVGQALLQWTAAEWPPLLQAALLTGAVVPFAVGVAVPSLLRVAMRIHPPRRAS